MFDVLKRIVDRKPKPDSFLFEGRTLVDGVDYFGERDKTLIRSYGYFMDGSIHGLNFVPSTPPEHR